LEANTQFSSPKDLLYAAFFAALTFAHRALCAFAILALALADMRRFLAGLPRVTLFFPPRIFMAELSVSN